MEIKENNIYCGDAYELIKQVKDKSVNIIYTDIPYLIATGGGGKSPLATRILKEHCELGNKSAESSLQLRIKELNKKMQNTTDSIEYEKYRVQKNNLQNALNLKKANIVDGIDYKILDEFVRVQPYIYIYIYGAAKNKFMI